MAALLGLSQVLAYLRRLAADPKRMLPRIPLLAPEQFESFHAADAELLDLHINYADAKPYPLAIAGDSVGHAQGNDRTVSGIPEQAHRYMLGSRSGVDWVVDRYQVTAVSVRTVEVVEALPGLEIVPEQPALAHDRLLFTNRHHERYKTSYTHVVRGAKLGRA